MKKLVILLLVVISLTGCCKDIDLTVKPLDPVTLELPEVAPVNMTDIEWHIITENNQEKVLGELKQPVLFGLSDQGYENLSLNFAKIMAYIEQQNKVIEIYKRYYEETEELKEEQAKDNKSLTPPL